MIALSIFRQLATRRPVGFLGQKSLRIGSIRCHNASGICQIVPNGLRLDLRRFMVVAPIAATIPYAAKSETSSNVWNLSVISVLSCSAWILERPSRVCWIAV